MRKEIENRIINIRQSIFWRKAVWKKFLPIFLFFISLAFMVNAGLLFFLEIIIPSYQLVVGNKLNYLISFICIAPFTVVYAVIMYNRLNKKVIDEIKFKQNIITALRKSEERYKTLFNNASDVIFILDFDGDIIDGNKIACEKLNYTKDEIRRMKISNIEVDRNFPQYENYSINRDYQQKLFYETNFLNKNGTSIPFEVDSTIIEYKNSRVIMLIARDITERKKAEQQLFIYQQQLKNLAAKLSMVQEEERRKIAVDLHDYIGQNLAISKLKLQLILFENKDQPQVKEVLDLINQTIPFIRDLTTSLSPTILYDLDFESAMEWLSEQFQSHYKLDVLLNYDQSQRVKLPDNIKIILFQSVRELLINIVKHSKVNYAFLNMEITNGYFNISVEDDGVGFDTSKLFTTFNSNSGFGLFSTKERIEFIGGEFLAESELGKFTKINLKVPLQ